MRYVGRVQVPARQPRSPEESKKWIRSTQNQKTPLLITTTLGHHTSIGLLEGSSLLVPVGGLEGQWKFGFQNGLAFGKFPKLGIDRVISGS